MIQLTQIEKETYLTKLTEENFREQIVRRLFKRLGLKDGRDLCGPEEKGKDAIFFETDAFGNDALINIQTKTGPVNLASDPSKNLQTILTQLRTALSVHFYCSATKTKKLPSRVYLVASGKINDAARTWITDSADKDPRINYLDRDDLIVLVDKYCPEIWIDIAADVFPYLSALSEKIEDRSVVGIAAALSSGLKGFTSASDLAYVDLKLIKSVSKTAQRNGIFEQTFEFKESNISEIVSARSCRLLILGDAGSGKSTMLMRAAYLIAREGAAGRSNYRIPVLLKASDIIQKREMIDLIKKSIDSIVGKEISAFSDTDLRDGKVVLLIDGLDEIANLAARAMAVGRVNEFFAQHPSCAIVVTTRPYSSIESIEGIRGYTRYRIAPMSFAIAEKMLLKQQKSSGDETLAREVLRRIDGIHGIELNPLLVSVFAATTQKDRKDIPANITELFSKFTELMLGRWDEDKGFAQQFESRVKEHILSAFAFNLHTDRRTEFFKDEFDSFAVELMREMNYDVHDVEVLTDEIFNRSGLLRSSDGRFEFRHHLVQEYFAGKGIPNIESVRKIVGDEWWRNPVVFYFGGRPKDVHDLLDVSTSFEGDVSEACLTIGIALQSCYLSKMTDKADVWKWVVENLAVCTQNILTGSDSEDYPLINFVAHYLTARDAVSLHGIDNSDLGAISWAMRENHNVTDPQFRRFWAMVGLCEIGKVDVALENMKTWPLASDKLNFALFTGSRLIELIRSVKPEQKSAAKDMQIRLTPKIAVVAHNFAKEYRGRLLEYRRGGIVALDEVESGHVEMEKAADSSQAKLSAFDSDN